MSLVQIRFESAEPVRSCQPGGGGAATIFWIQGITLAWMLIECGVSLYAAAAAHSPAMLAFGSDSLVELLSAGVVLLAFLPNVSVSEKRVTRAAGGLLFVLAGAVFVIATLSLAMHVHPEVSLPGIGITLAALMVMPLLAWMKRKEARRRNSAALAADSVQSMTCAYLALVALGGLLMNRYFQISWFDPVAALIAIPFLVKEGRAAWAGKACGCC
jgi:divalent metal cation (Fe/Co/Zn/Cd) transporter